MGLSRREFLTVSGSVAVLGGCAALPSVTEVASMKRVPMQAKVVVAGGGLAGVCAAIAAARNGAKVVLIQDRSRLGGNSSSEIRMHVCGANNTKPLAIWRETGIIEELKLTEAATNPQRSFHIWDLILYDKVVSEPNITLLLDTSVVGARLRGDRIAAVEAICPSTEERFEIEADCCVDCTGDGGLAALAGAERVKGREGRYAYDESLAPNLGDSKTMGSSLIFFARRHNKPMPFTPPAWAKKFTKEDLENRRIYSWEYGYWWIEWGGEIDTVADNRRIRHELLRDLMGVWDYIKNSGKHPDSENWALDFVGMIPGKRESRRIVGEHVLVQKEVETAELFPDRVSYGGWPLDDHPPGGIDARNLRPAEQKGLDKPYSIPLRSLYSVNRANLFMAGRNISASHVAMTSTRVMATCAAMGQAAGTAAAFCAREDRLPKEVANDAARMRELQQLLLRDDQALLGVRNEDESDLARRARVSSSVELPEGPAASVIDGWNRDIGDGATHQWRAAMNGGIPWLRLDWDEPQSIASVQLTFDSGLSRKLFLSGEDSQYSPQTRGVQPETVAAYAVEVLVGEDWREVVRAQNNVLRLVRHRFEPVTTRAVRLRVIQTNGDPVARVFEVRCYA
jgi:hypothetical protein